MRKLNENKDGILITVPSVCEKVNLSKTVVLRLARESGAYRKIGKSARIDWPVFYRYLSTFEG